MIEIAPPAESDARLRRWERASDWPLTLAAALFLGAYAWPILDQHLRGGWRGTCSALVVATWAAFFGDYVVRVVVAPHRRTYVWRHLPDLAVLALPALRPLRLVRVLLLLKMLNRGATAGLRGRIAIYVVGATAVLLFCSSLTVLDAERGQANGNIRTFGDALWWSVTTITTVGYGDRYPLTATGRWVAAGLMMGGIALVGVVTASIASWLIDRVRETEQQIQAATRDDVQLLAREIAELRADIAAMRPVAQEAD